VVDIEQGVRVLARFWTKRATLWPLGRGAGVRLSAVRYARPQSVLKGLELRGAGGMPLPALEHGAFTAAVV